MFHNRKIVLDSRPTDKVSPGNFRLVEDRFRRRGRGRSWCATIICRSTLTCAAG